MFHASLTLTICSGGNHGLASLLFSVWYVLRVADCSSKEAAEINIGARNLLLIQALRRTDVAQLGRCTCFHRNSRVECEMKLFHFLVLTFLCLILLVLPPVVGLYASDADIISQVETVLKEAARDANHRHRDSTERAIHDITYLVEQSWKAKDKSQDVARKDYAKQARALVVRGARMGHFDITKTAPALKMIEELISDQAG